MQGFPLLLQWWRKIVTNSCTVYWWSIVFGIKPPRGIRAQRVQSWFVERNFSNDLITRKHLTKHTSEYLWFFPRMNDLLLHACLDDIYRLFFEHESPDPRVGICSKHNVHQAHLEDCLPKDPCPHWVLPVTASASDPISQDLWQTYLLLPK